MEGILVRHQEEKLPS